MLDTRTAATYSRKLMQVYKTIPTFKTAYFLLLLFFTLFFYPFNTTAYSDSVAGKLKPIPAVTGERQDPPWTGGKSIAEAQSITHTHLGKILSHQLTQHACFWTEATSFRVSSEYVERTHTYTGRTCTFHTERPLFKGPGPLQLTSPPLGKMSSLCLFWQKSLRKINLENK